MLEELDSLGAKLTELSAHVRRLREENAQLRVQLNTAGADLDAMRAKVAQATQRIDALLERLPQPVARNE